MKQKTLLWPQALLLCALLLGVFSSETLNAQLTFDLEVGGITCEGLNNGYAQVSNLNGSGSYQFFWTHDALADDPYEGQIPAGTHTVGVQDLVTFESATEDFVIAEPQTLVAYFEPGSISNPDCGFCNGSATVTITGGTAPYSITWPPGITVVSADGLTATGFCPGITYAMPVTDANNCNSSASFIYGGCEGELPTRCRYRNLTEGTAWTTTSDCTYLACEGDNVRLMVQPLGVSAANFTYAWSGGTPNPNYPHVITPDGSDTYTVTIYQNGYEVGSESFLYDENICQVPVQCRTRNITEGGSWTVDADCSYEACAGDNVRLWIKPTVGAASDYSYSWNMGTPNNAPYGFVVNPTQGTGTYTVTITDGDGNQTIASIDYVEQDCTPNFDCRIRNFTQNIPWEDSPSCNPNACVGENVRLMVRVDSGSTSDYNYSWNMGIPTYFDHVIRPDVFGLYICTITDLNGNFVTSQTIIFTESPECEFEEPELECRYLNLTQGIAWSDSGTCSYVACPGDNVRLMIRPVEGAATDYTYVWDAGTVGSSDHIINPSAGPGTYNVTLTDANGNQTQASFSFDDFCPE